MALADRFELRARLGAGGFGVVYRAHDRVQGRDVALKTMGEADPTTLARFKNEFRALADLAHPNLVTLYHLFADDDWYFTMELIEGVHLLDHVRPDGTRSPTDSTAQPETSPDSPRARRWTSQPRGESLVTERLRAVLPQVVAGVDALHRAGKLHRDLKPSNVLVRRDGRAVVCDFGLVVDVGDAGAWLGRGGTPVYMSPEQATGEALTPASDWYAVGVMMYEALTGRLPFEGSAREIAAAKVERDPPPPTGPADLVALCAALLRREPDARPDAASILAQLGARPITAVQVPFVGRDRELAALHDALATSRRRSVAVLVDGPSGIGKTALCHEFLAEAARGGALVLEGRCYERESVPYKALDALVDALARHLAERTSDEVTVLLTEEATALARIFPVLRRIPVLEAHRATAQLPADPQRLRATAFRGLRDVLGALARERPVVLFIDDLQWGDPDSAGFFVELVHGRDAPPVLLVATYLSGDPQDSALVGALLARRIGTTADLRRLPVGGLGEAAGAELARALVGGDVGDLVAEAGGHPLLLAALAEAAAGGAAIAGLGLDDVLRQRIDRLAPEARELLVTIAIAGLPTPVALLAGATSIADLPSALTALRAARLIRTRSEEIEVFHDRVRVVARAGLDADAVRAVHRRLAEAASGGDPFALVEHWLGAGEGARAAEQAVVAAALSEEALAFARAATYHKVVLEHAALTDDERRDRHARRAEALAQVGDLREAAAAFLAAADGADPDRAIELRRRAVEHLLRSGDLEAGLALSEQLLAEVGLSMPRTRRAALTQLLTRRAWLAVRGLGVKPRERVDPALLRRIDVCHSMAAGLSFVDPLIGASFQARHLSLALSSGDVGRAALAVALEIGFRGTAGAKARADAVAVAERARRLAEQAGDRALGGWSAAGRGLTAFLCGDFEAALDDITAAQRRLGEDPARFRWQLDLTQIYRIATLLYLGRLRELTRVVPALLRDALDHGEVHLANGLRAQRTNIVWLILDDPDEAERQLRAVTPPGSLTTRFHLHHWFVLSAEVHQALYRGDAATAWRALDARWPELEASMLLRMQMTRIESRYLRARVALAVDQPEPAAKAAKQLEKEGVPWGAALAATIRAALAGEPADAIAQLERAVAGFDATGMRAHAAAARWRLGARRGDDAMIAGARAWLDAEGVVAPDKLLALLVP